MVRSWLKALSLLCAAACVGPISERAHAQARIGYDMGVASLNRGDTREALRALLGAVRDDPQLPEAHHVLGLVLHAMGKDGEALDHYKLAVRLKDNFSEAYNNMGVLLLDMGRHDAAIAALEAALSNILYPTPYLAEGNLGWAYYQKGDVALARQHLGNAVATHPRFCRGYEWLTRIALERDEASEVVAQGERFVRHCLQDAAVAPSIPVETTREVQYYLAIGHLKRGERALARDYLSQCALQGPEVQGFAAKCAGSLQALR